VIEVQSLLPAGGGLRLFWRLKLRDQKSRVMNLTSDELRLHWIV
jgi:hypothetical protein